MSRVPAKVVADMRCVDPLLPSGVLRCGAPALERSEKVRDESKKWLRNEGSSPLSKNRNQILAKSRFPPVIVYLAGLA